MGIDLVEKVYAEGDFTPLSEHNQQTPTSFFAAKPVLHLHVRAVIKASEDVLAKIPNLAKLSSTTDSAQQSEGNADIGSVDVWVTSKYVIKVCQAQRLMFPDI